MVNIVNDNKRPPYGIIVVLMFGAFIAFLNNTLLNIALPSIMDDFQVPPSMVQWVTTGFMLVSGILIPVTAYLIEKYTVRRLFLTAIGLFSIGTILAGLSPFFFFLVLGRMIQASGSAIMMPLLMNVMLVSFPIEIRGRAMGYLGFIMMFAPAIGPTLSGFIIEQFGTWRALFFLVAPIAIVIFLIGFFRLRDHKEKSTMKLEKLSLFLSSIGFGSLLFGFSFAGNNGWLSPIVYGPILIGIISLIFFTRRQLRLERPMLNLTVFRYGMFSLSSFILIIVHIAMFSGILLIPIYLQNILGVSPLDSGLMMLPGAIANAIMSPITGQLFDRFGGRILAVTGLTIITVSTFFFSILTVDGSPYVIMWVHAVRMFGMSMVMMPVQTNGLNQLPRSLYPHGTAMNNTLNQVSAALGTGLMITIMTIRQNSVFAALIKETTENLGGAEISDQLLLEIQQQATVSGINVAFLASTIFAAIALISAMFIKRAKPDEKTCKGNKPPKLEKEAVVRN